MQTKTQERPVGINDASAITGLAVQTIYDKACKRTIPHYKQGGKLLFFETELLDWVRQGKRKSRFEIDQAVDAAIAGK